ncbi:MAG: hypothetical protein EON95_20985 [Caulobacteraceae bacterium]|nr:MAG: hypothetical protein EON95_20985 [Caulobacteraceae bacterium]
MNIVDFLADYKCPAINGFYYESGDIAIIDYNTKGRAVVNVIAHSNIYNVNIDAVGLVDFDYMGERSFGDVVARYGEGSSGGDGVFCLLSKDTKRMQWFLFLDNSNPFCNVEFFDDDILLHTTSGAIFSIPLDRPELIEVIRSPDF